MSIVYAHSLLVQIRYQRVHSEQQPHSHNKIRKISQKSGPNYGNHAGVKYKFNECGKTFDSCSYFM